MIIVLASRFDASAARLVERWHARGVRLLLPEGLSVRGWRYEPEALHRSTAVIEGDVVSFGSINGVITRLLAVGDSELPHIVEEERAYVAAEMTAYLLAWLSSLDSRVLNRPTPTCLSGPSWGSEQWVHQAASVGFSIRPVHRVARRFFQNAAIDASHEPFAAADADVFQVTLVGGRLLGPIVDDDTKRKLNRLAERTNVELLTVTFVRDAGSTLFVGASTWVDIDNTEVADAIFERWGIVN